MRDLKSGGEFLATNVHEYNTCRNKFQLISLK